MTVSNATVSDLKASTSLDDVVKSSSMHEEHISIAKQATRATHSNFLV
jgi:hypothetical protein